MRDKIILLTGEGVRAGIKLRHNAGKISINHTDTKLQKKGGKIKYEKGARKCASIEA